MAATFRRRLNSGVAAYWPSAPLAGEKGAPAG